MQIVFFFSDLRECKGQISGEVISAAVHLSPVFKVCCLEASGGEVQEFITRKQQALAH